MCGIAGAIDFGGPVDGSLLHRMCAAMEHRGPDSRGVLVWDGAGLGAQRLAIIDVAGGQQPVVNEDETIAVVLNGEIYNFAELRADLLRRGHRFRSRVDTEVLVHLYEERGERMVEDLQGMFAFAIWDAPRRRLVCARDRAGKKPLFWARRGRRVWFASELGALLQEPAIERSAEPRAIEAFLALQYVPDPLCAFRGVHKLSPASVLTVTERGEQVSSYWSLDYDRKLEPLSGPELQEQVRAAIRNATRRRLISEVPLGAFLSGGIDSSAVVAAMAEEMAEPVKTFSISFSEAGYDESGYARLVAEQFGTDHHEFRVEPDAVALMPRLARHYGEPFADPAAVPTFQLAELARRHVTVALNGDGGDETFGGYPRYRWPQGPEHLGWLPAPLRRSAPFGARLLGRPRRAGDRRDRAQDLGRSLAMDPAQRYAQWVAAFDRDRRERLRTGEFAASLGGFRAESVITAAWGDSTASSRLDRMLDVDVRTYLPGNGLTKTDIATMAHSLEARSPLLDHELMELTAAIPPGEKIGKRILVSALRGVLPDSVLDRPKQGFIVPLTGWLRSALGHLPGEMLLDPVALDRGYFRRREVERLIREHREATFDHSLRLWVLLQLETWHREMVDQPPGTSRTAAPSLDLPQSLASSE